MEILRILLVVSSLCSSCVLSRFHEGPPPGPLPATFSGVFDHNVVLQRSPAKAALFGNAGNFTGSTAEVTVTVTASTESLRAGQTYTSAVDSDGNWKVFLNPAAAGGDYTITVACTSSTCSNKTETTLVNVTFGDIYFCSGQSNMELTMTNTFSRNDTLDAIAKGKYHNIRIRLFPHYPQPEPTYMVGQGMGKLNGDAPSTWLTAQQAQEMQTMDRICPWCGTANRSILTHFSAACFYFAQALTDELGEDAPPMGMIASSVGGTMIELWTPKEDIGNCKNTSCGNKIDPNTCSTLYNGMVCPFVNMTVKGYLWYQGENNVFADTGNSMEKTGYGCMLPNMVQAWRKAWSVVPGTTDPLAPFGIYTLAGGTSEGHGTHMGAFRWSETANHGIVPNPTLPNAFMASGYDLGDPWAKDCYFKNCCTHGVVEPKPPCSGDLRWSWWATNYFMGPIHPRPKLFFATRLARAAASVVYDKGGPFAGPYVAGCTVSGDKIEVRFNTTLLQSGGDKVSVQDYNMTLAMQASAMEVATNETDPPLAPDKADGNWTFVNIQAGEGGTSIVVDLSPLNGTAPTAIRYAWGDYPCCGLMDRSLAPCPMGSCPVLGMPSKLPALPFFALIRNNKCQCIPPQKCDG